jgi:uncharacterized membrane protein YfcA
MSHTLTDALILLLSSTIVGLCGLGGGVFYMPLLLFLNYPPHEAAALSNLGVFLASSFAALLYLREKKVDPLIILFVEVPTAIGSFFGGYISHLVGEVPLKYLLISITFAVGTQLTLGLKPPPLRGKVWIKREEYSFPADTLGVLSLLVGGVVGTAGMGGGIFKLPLMLAAGIPYPIAVGTSLSMITITSGASLLSRYLSVGPALFRSYEVVLLLPIGAVSSALLAKKLRFPDLRRLFGGVLLTGSLMLLAKELLRR